MNYNEPNALLRRIPFRVINAAGRGVAGLTIAGAQLQVSKSGAPFVNGGGTVIEVGGGLYAYVATQAETATESFLALKVLATGGRPIMMPIDIGERIVTGEVDADKRVIPIYLENAAGQPVPGLTLDAADVQLSQNGAAYANTDNAAVEVSDGLYIVVLSEAEVSASGFRTLRATKAPALVYELAFSVVSAVAGTPTISNISPIDGNITPGEPGAFSATFSTARRTPITFDLAGISSGSAVTISAKYANRNETYTLRDVEGSFVWPCDVQADNTFTVTGEGTASVSLLPRGGWPATTVELKVAVALRAVPA